MHGTPHLDRAPLDFDPFEGGELESTCPATESQREIWAATQLGDDANCAFNESVTVTFDGNLDVGALTRAIEALVRRHESLRATFSPDGEHLCIGDGSNIVVDQLDCEAEPDALAITRLKHVTRPFDLVNGPLVRFVVIRKSNNSHALVMTAHHVICDGWSIAVLLRDLARLYAKAATNSDAAIGPAGSFAEYSRATGRVDSTETIRYWLQQYQGEVPLLDLPTDRNRPPLRRFESARHDFQIGADLVGDLKRLAGIQKTSFFALMFAAWNVLLFRLTGQGDIVTGVPTAGQAAAGMPDVVGQCVNLLPIRMSMRDDASFADVLARTGQTLLDALDHQQFTFGTLLQQLKVARDPSRIPLVSVQFNLDPPMNYDDMGFPGLTARLASNPREYENFELFLNLSEASSGIKGECQYSRSLFLPETVRDWIDSFEVLLKGIASDPSAAIGRLPILSPTARRNLDRWNDTNAAFDLTVRADQMIARQCAATPDSVAVRFVDDALSYAALETESDRVAAVLRARGIRAGDRVGIALPRSIHLIPCVIAIWKVGAAYVPLDPEFPAERLQFMANDAALRTVIADADFADTCPNLAVDILWLRDLIDRSNRVSVKTETVELPSDAVAYVIYTSGSTGRPKGVQVPHRAVSNFLCSMGEYPGIGPSDVLVGVTTLSFDISVLELFLPLTVGATVVVASNDEARDGRLLADLLRSCQATVMQATPATWRMLVDIGFKSTTPFRALCGGEALDADLARALQPRVDALFNMYGPTETTVWSSAVTIDSTDDGIRVGGPIRNTQFAVLSENGEAQPIGVVGELYIGGDGVALDYFNRPELTRERFVTLDHTVGDHGARRFYRTGDRVRWRRDGCLEFRGRSDTQTKVRGYRIELGEISSVLANHAAISEAVAKVYEPAAGDARIVAYYVTRDAGPLESRDLHDHLSRTLPAYMLPQHLIGLDAMPRTPNGKVDRAALPEPVTRSQRLFVEPTSELEIELCSIWRDVLKVDRVGLDDDFFDLGGHSILATRVVAQVRDRLGIQLSMRRIFEAPTVNGIARQIETLLQLTSAPPSDEIREQLSF